MHRSGTSMVARLIASTGVILANDKVGPASCNPHGYFEDAAFLTLNRELLRHATREGGAGHPDWGWTENEAFDTAVAEPLRERARQLVLQRERESFGSPWGWKDPRASLLLPFWDQVFSTARYVFIYRRPWDVADSMQRLGAEVFLTRPDYAWRIWSYYNRRILEFHHAHRERTLLVCAETVWRYPERLIDLIQHRFNLPKSDSPGGASALVDRELFQMHEAGDPLTTLASALNPEAADLLRQLDEAADLPPASSQSGALDARIRQEKTTTPQVSVIIPCYNQGEYLAEAIASVERNLQETFEVIVVDDGSTQESTQRALHVLQQAGYQIIHQQNRGLSAARNRGIEAARGKYILPLDADNRLRAGFVSKAVRLLDAQNESGIVYSDRQDFGLRNEWVDVPPFDSDLLLVSNYIDACAVFRKEVWATVGGYDQQASAWGDWDFWLGALERGWKFAHLEITGFDYRVRPGSMLAIDNEPATRRQWCQYLAAKHASLYNGRLPNVLLIAQRFITDLFTLSREHERLGVEFTRVRNEFDSHRRGHEAESGQAPSVSEMPDLSFYVPDLTLPRKMTCEKARLDALLGRARQYGLRTFQRFLRPFRRQRKVNEAMIEAARTQARISAGLVNRVNHLILCIEKHEDLFRVAAATPKAFRNYVAGVFEKVAVDSAKLDDLQATLATRHAQDEALAAGLKEVEAHSQASANDFQKRTEGFEGQLARFRSELERGAANLETLTANVGPTQAELATLHRRLDRLQTQANWIGRNINRQTVLRELDEKEDSSAAG